MKAEQKDAERVEHQFDAYCKKVIHNSTINNLKKLNTDILLQSLSMDEAIENDLYAEDLYEKKELQIVTGIVRQYIYDERLYNGLLSLKKYEMISVILITLCGYDPGLIADIMNVKRDSVLKYSRLGIRKLKEKMKNEEKSF